MNSDGSSESYGQYYTNVADFTITTLRNGVCLVVMTNFHYLSLKTGQGDAC